MPPRSTGKGASATTGAGKGKGKAPKKKKDTAAETRTSPRKRAPSPELGPQGELEEAGGTQVELRELRDISSPEDDTDSLPGSQGQLSQDVEEKIAQFYEANPMYYDLGHRDYKNRPKKNATLKEFADSIGITREYLPYYPLFSEYLIFVPKFVK